MPKTPTPPIGALAETAALYAVMEDRIGDARRIIGDMYPSERAQFADQLESLARIARGTPQGLCELLGIEADR